jgi:hypothetical protein
MRDIVPSGAPLVEPPDPPSNALPAPARRTAIPRAAAAGAAPATTSTLEPSHDQALVSPGLPAAPPRVSSLTREIALLDESRTALAAGNTAEALRLLDGYAATFPRGALEPEAIVLRIDALVRRHETAAARALADSFERSHPGDSHISRIRSLLSQTEVP